jgi:hypothetical protein
LKNIEKGKLKIVGVCVFMIRQVNSSLRAGEVVKNLNLIKVGH